MNSNSPALYACAVMAPDGGILSTKWHSAPQPSLQKAVADWTVGRIKAVNEDGGTPIVVAVVRRLSIGETVLSETLAGS